MASIIIPSNFYGDLTLAQIGNTSVQSDVQKYIDKFEQEYLFNLLGYSTKKSLDAGALNILKEGVEYISRFNNLLSKWIGLNFQNNASPIASYIYCKYMIDNQTKTTPAGEKNVQAINAATSNANRKIMNQWNWMVDRNRELIDYLMSNQDIYPDFVSYFNSYFWLSNGQQLLSYAHNVF